MLLERIKGMRGILWRKITEKKPEKEEVELSGFQIEMPQTFIELPPADELTKVDVRYPLILPFAYAHIRWNPDEKQLNYFLEEPKLTDVEKKLLKEVSSNLIDLIEVGLSSIKSTPEATKYLEGQIQKVVKEFSVPLNPEQYIRIMYYIYRDFIGLNEIEPFLRDPWLEEIGCDGINIPLYVVHRKYGSIKTNVVYGTIEELREFVIKLAERCGRYVSYAEPILDGTLPDGSRVNATLAGDVSTRGPTFSIRKFAERPFSPIDQILLGTASPTIMAYFWYLVESGVSLMIAGGVATGKTSFLNSISMFIPPEAKIVSIEDTRELRLPHEHWIPSVTRLGFGIPMPTGEKYGEITLFDLLKGSFRQNPDYVIVGEVRGKEAYVMFQGMSSGHPCMSTFHAGSVDTVIKRLTTPPIELSASLVESLDAIAIMIHAKERGKSARRVLLIDEIISIKHGALTPETFRAVEWDPISDSFKFDKSSHLLQKIAKNKGTTVEETIEEIKRRKSILEWMVKMDIRDFVQVREIINEYYKNPTKILSQIGEVKPFEITEPIVSKEGPEEKVEKAPEKKREKEEKPKKVSASNVFGYKIVAEK